jgi:hypothetical protein
MVLALLAGLAVLMLVAFVTCTAICVAAARADRLMKRTPPGSGPVRPDAPAPASPRPALLG